MNFKYTKNYPVFIVGLPRSGTTLLTQILNASGQIFFGPETHFFFLVKQFLKKENLTDHQLNCIISKLFSFKYNPFFKYYDLSDELTLLKEKILNKNNVYEILSEICKIPAEKKGISRWGEKTPRHYYFVKNILSGYPDAKIINILRDPRDVFLSMKNVPWGTVNPYQIGRRYKTNVSIVKKNIDSDRFMNVFYEDLVKFPQNELKKICDFIDIDFQVDMILNIDKDENLNFNKIKEPWKVTNNSTISTSKIEKWKQEKSPEIYFLSWFLEEEISYTDYEYINNNFFLKNIYYLLRNALYDFPDYLRGNR